jgi:hypothetical protein
MIDDKEVKKQNAIDKGMEPQSHVPKVESELSESDIEQVAGGGGGCCVGQSSAFDSDKKE